MIMCEIIIKASNIKCGGCVANIEKGLADFAGVTEVSVEVESNVVSLKGNNLIKSDIEKKLIELGYPVISN